MKLTKNSRGLRVKITPRDGGAQITKLQGLKHKDRGYFVIILELGWTAGWFQLNPGALLQKYRANRYLAIWSAGSWSGGSGLKVSGSNLGRWLWIGWPGRVGRAGAAVRSAGDLLRGGALRGLAGVHRLRCSGGQINQGFVRGWSTWHG